MQSGNVIFIVGFEYKISSAESVSNVALISTFEFGTIVDNVLLSIATFIFAVGSTNFAVPSTLSASKVV